VLPSLLALLTLRPTTEHQRHDPVRDHLCTVGGLVPPVFAARVEAFHAAIVFSGKVGTSGTTLAGLREMVQAEIERRQFSTGHTHRKTEHRVVESQVPCATRP
jgi:hypothetical protein